MHLGVLEGVPCPFSILSQLHRIRIVYFPRIVYESNFSNSCNIKEGCAKYGMQMEWTYLCKGCNRAVHWFCSMDYDASKDEAIHGSHYWCPTCWEMKMPSSTKPSEAACVGDSSIVSGISGQLKSPFRPWQPHQSASQGSGDSSYYQCIKEQLLFPL